MMYRYRRFVLGSLVLLALVLRVWALDWVPPSLDADEVSIGYNAHSILRTGRDEYGVPWPLSFRAYGEYKRPAYIYAAVPSIAVFGPTPLGVRFPAALAGALSVAVLYAVATLLLRSWRAGLCAALLLTLSPWHLQFTRAAREASLLVLACLLLAAALLGAWHLRPLAGRRAGLLYVGAALAFLLAVYSYPGGLLLAPLLVAALVRAYWGRLRRSSPPWVATAVLIAGLGLIPLGVQFVDGRAQARLGQVSLFNEPGLRQLAESRVERDRRDGAPWLLNHPWMVGLRRAVDAYLGHFDPTYLFTRGDREWRHHSTDAGQLQLWDIPLLGAGLFVALRHRRRPAMQALVAWLLVAPLPAALAENAPHAVRSIGMLPAWYLIGAAGVRPLWGWLYRRGYERDWLLLLGLSFVFYFYMFTRYYPVEHGQSWNSGRLEAYRAAAAEVATGRFERVVIPQEIWGDYVYALYATRYDPRAYLAQGGSVVDPEGPFYPAPGPLQFEPFEVRVVDWSVEPRRPEVLYVLHASTRKPAGLEVVSVIKGVTAQDAMQLLAYPRGSA
ncbi:MAG TPA: glycosyltransferase family 39 protein [Chloroflexota bacterium]|nr:glycosyltransferase family 39 protein [Chloroflexota bacterium]